MYTYQTKNSKNKGLKANNRYIEMKNVDCIEPVYEKEDDVTPTGARFTFKNKNAIIVPMYNDQYNELMDLLMGK